MRVVAFGAMLMLVATAACDKKPDVPAATTSVATTTDATATVPAAAGAVAGKNWLDEMVATPEGGFRVGNPDAKVKLVEYASLTCPHCRDFKSESDADLHAKYIATGKVSYEYRNFLLNGPDMAASVLARCEGPRQFFNLMNAFYASQGEWTEPFTKMTPEDSKRIGALPQDQQVAAVAKIGGLDKFMRARGMTGAQFDKCIDDAAALKRLTDMQSEASGKLGVSGTPTFFINGVKQDGINTWPQLEPKLVSAL